MAKKINREALETLIEGRLAMQSTQRNLAVYGIANASLKYFSTEDFRKKYSNFHPLEKRRFLNIVAGPIFWKSAADLIEGNKV